MFTDVACARIASDVEAGHRICQWLNEHLELCRGMELKPRGLDPALGLPIHPAGLWASELPGLYIEYVTLC